MKYLSSKNGFYIFEGGQFRNSGFLNQAGFTLLNCLIVLSKNDPEFLKDFMGSVKKILVTSQDRGSGQHIDGYAIDITVYPLGLNLWLYTRLRDAFKYTVYISSHNRHIHFDLREESLFGMEMVERYGKKILPLLNQYNIYNSSTDVIRIVDTKYYSRWLMDYYRVADLHSLKFAIWRSFEFPIEKDLKIITEVLPGQIEKALKEIKIFPVWVKPALFIGGGLFVGSKLSGIIQKLKPPKKEAGR